MASRGRGARNKGAQFEREIAKRLTDLTEGNYEFKRGLGQTRSAATEGADVQCDKLKDIIHIECKRHKRSPIKPALEQAINDCGDAIPIVITKDDREPELVTMRMQEWEPMFLAWLSSRQGDQE